MSRRHGAPLRLALFAAALLGAGPAAPAPAGDIAAGPPATATAGGLQTRLDVAPGVWVLVETGFQVQPTGNVTIVEQADGLVLIDAGGSPGAGRRIVAQVRALSAKPVKAVVLTHWHGDHVQGLSEILAAWPAARTLATAATQAHLRDPGAMNSPASPDPAANAALQSKLRGYSDYARRMAVSAPSEAEQTGWTRAAALFDSYRRDMDGALTVAPREAFSERLVLPDRERPVELAFLGRANTDGDAVAWLPRQKVLVSGDIVVTPVPFGYGSYPGAWIATLRRLEAYPFRTLVPGHGPPQHDAAGLRRLIDALAEIRAKVAPLAATGLSPGEIRARLDVSDQAEMFAGGDPWLRRWVAAYWLDPIVASAVREARGEPIVQGLGGG
ncbi:MBL fold metallo-hydrolase [Phenylobacterium sp.]|uniref:MBL fold metallo-hydrolase n=1 Tax=Phenylobacterium sp. TaxID=1871053 RepID=UPI0025FD055D|nr:MBL fold metallo-hydrolase [Phenylobacterium sp.]